MRVLRSLPIVIADQPAKLFFTSNRAEMLRFKCFIEDLVVHPIAPMWSHLSSARLVPMHDGSEI